MDFLQTFKQVNRWRRGANIPQPCPTEIGIALDSLIYEIEKYRAKRSITSKRKPLKPKQIKHYL